MLKLMVPLEIGFIFIFFLLHEMATRESAILPMLSAKVFNLKSSCLQVFVLMKIIIQNIKNMDEVEQEPSFEKTKRTISVLFSGDNKVIF